MIKKSQYELDKEEIERRRKLSRTGIYTDQDVKKIIVEKATSFLVTIIVVVIIGLIGLFILTQLELKTGMIHVEQCDYDSCSQVSYLWKYNGSNCFDENDPSCREFLNIWNACQEHKKQVGVC